MDMVEVNPALGSGEGQRTTITLGVELVESALGKAILAV
jgi:arginase family enzyme